MVLGLMKSELFMIGGNVEDTKTIKRREGDKEKSLKNVLMMMMIICWILMRIGSVEAKEMRKDYGTFMAPQRGHFSLEMNFKMDVEFTQNTTLAGNYLVSQATVLSYSTPSTVVRNPLTDYGFYSLDFSRVTSGLNDGKVNVTFTTNPPPLLNLNPYSFRLFVLDEVTKKFYFPEGISDVDSIQPLNFVLRRVSGKVFTIGLFAYDKIQIVEPGDEIPIYYKRTVQFNWQLCGIEKVKISFPNAIQTSRDKAPILSFASSNSEDSGNFLDYVPISNNIFSISKSSVEMNNSVLSFVRDPNYETVCTYAGEQIYVDEDSFTCGFSLLDSPDNITISESYRTEDGQIICPLLNETVYSVFILAKRQNNPEETIENPITTLVQNTTNRFVLQKGAKLTCLIELGPKAKIILSVRSAFDPDVYIGMNFVPSPSGFDFFMGGTSTKTIVNPSDSPIKVYVLVDASYSKGTGMILIIPTITDYVVPPHSETADMFHYWILVGATSISLTIGMCVLGIVIAVFIFISRKKDVLKMVGSTPEQYQEMLNRDA